MISFACEKCGSVDVFIDDRGNQKALMCGDCGKWLKWVGKKEMPLVERYINDQKSLNIVNEEFINMEIKIKSKDVNKLVEFLKGL